MMKLQLIFELRFFLVFLCVFAPLREIKAQSLPKKTEKKIRAVLNSPSLKEAHVGLSILDLGTVENANSFPAKVPKEKPFRVVFESDAHKKFMSASNMKLFTAAIVLELLGKDKTFPTTVIQRSPSPPRREESFGLMGGGDPSLDDEGLGNLARQVKNAGIDEMKFLWGDGNAFGAETMAWNYPFGWTMDDALWYYGPSISSIAYNRNQMDVTVTGGEYVGAPANIVCDPPYNVGNFVETTDGEQAKATDGDLLRVERSSGLYGQISLFGQISLKQEIKLGLAIPDPPSWAAVNFKRRLGEAGVSVNLIGNWNAVANYPPRRDAGDYSPNRVIAQHNSPPLKTLFQRLLKKSDNLYAEMLLRDAAYYHDGEKNGTAPRAHELLKKWLAAQNIDASSLRFEDGSGLSRYNLLTPRATAELLAAINRMKDGDVIWDALPIAGTDGTLKKRMTSTPSAGNVRAKSGTFSIASNLSGYVTTRDNRRLAVALFINFARDTAAAQSAQDEIFTILAGADL